KREDPTVIALEERGAALLGHEAAVYVPTATMANQIALRLLSEPGDELIAHSAAHVVRYELGGPAVHSGLSLRAIETDDGRFGTEEVRAAVNPRADLHMPVTRIVSLENTHNGGGGRVWSLDDVRAVAEEARRHGLAVHLDGARLLNACAASGNPASAYGREADAVTLCLSKGLGCPLGALLATSAERAPKARRLKHLFGGAMRQAGIVAAAGLYALAHHVERLAEDHANARRLAEGFVEGGLPVDLGQVETNFVLLDVARMGFDPDEAVARLRVEGVGLSFASRSGVLRAVTHLDVSREDVERAVPAVARALAPVGAYAGSRGP
ncbi:MAG: DegT/DnrJ/EryC1/StrS family aminotransferase, partial [Thermoleophilia bacterium]|nr:DegT/DnrJ/EryC1/StrS family aminotransferase [Thermoleophilia bacterium]